MASKKPEDKEQNPSWGPESEIKFIDGLGTHRKAECKVERPDDQWLKMYIQSHTASPHSHHKAGVKYAQKKLEHIYHG